MRRISHARSQTISGACSLLVFFSLLSDTFFLIGYSSEVSLQRTRALAAVAAERQQSAHKKFAELAERAQTLFMRVQMISRGLAAAELGDDPVVEKFVRASDCVSVASLLLEAQLVLHELLPQTVRRFWPHLPCLAVVLSFGCGFGDSTSLDPLSRCSRLLRCVCVCL